MAEQKGEAGVPKAERVEKAATKAKNYQSLHSADNPPELADIAKLHEPIMRERREPRDGYEPVPLWLVGLFMALVFWGGGYLMWYSGGFQANVLDERPNWGRTGAAEDEPKDPMVIGQAVYTGRCVSCHQQDGQGQAGQYPPLVGSRWVLEHPQQLKRILLHGLEGPIEVKGATYNGNMPAFGNDLNDEQIAAVLTYIRGTWGNTASPISPESVAATRKATEGRGNAWTAGELEKITEPDFTEPKQGEGEGTGGDAGTKDGGGDAGTANANGAAGDAGTN